MPAKKAAVALRTVAALIAFLLACPPAGAEKAPARKGTRILPVRRGVIESIVRVTGFAEPYKMWQVRAPYDGRVEAVLVKSQNWVDQRDPLILLATPELAAMIDAAQTTPTEILEKRWKDVFRPTEIHSPFPKSVILKVHTETRSAMITGDILMDIASSFKLSVDMPASAKYRVRPGRNAVLWPADDPENQIECTVTEVAKLENAEGYRVTIVLPPKAPDVRVGTPLLGLIQAGYNERALLVPSRAVTYRGGKSFLHLEVETGLDNGVEVEIAGGAKEGDLILLPEVEEEEKETKPGKK